MRISKVIRNKIRRDLEKTKFLRAKKKENYELFCLDGLTCGFCDGVLPSEGWEMIDKINNIKDMVFSQWHKCLKCGVDQVIELTIINCDTYLLMKVLNLSTTRFFQFIVPK